MKAKKNHPSGLVQKDEPDTLTVEQPQDERMGRTLARVLLDPTVRNAKLAVSYGSHVLGVDGPRPDANESSAALAELVAQSASGDLSLATRIHAAQAVSLDAMFTELARQATCNLAPYPLAAERYLRLAIKAQAACRATLEALARLHQPREQTVKHVHVSDGGQAVIADTFHHETGGFQIGDPCKQSHAKEDTRCCCLLPRSDTRRDAVPVSGGTGEVEVQDARGHEPRTA